MVVRTAVRRAKDDHSAPYRSVAPADEPPCSISGPLEHAPRLAANNNKETQIAADRRFAPGAD
jgi:hypothetical protein